MPLDALDTVAQHRYSDARSSQDDDHRNRGPQPTPAHLVSRVAALVAAVDAVQGQQHQLVFQADSFAMADAVGLAMAAIAEMGDDGLHEAGFLRGGSVILSRVAPEMGISPLL